MVGNFRTDVAWLYKQFLDGRLKTVLDLNSPIINQSSEVKTCVHCGEVNYQDRGQCKNCGRTRFISEKEFAKERRAGASAMIVGPIMFFISLALLLYRYSPTAPKSNVPKWVMLPFVLLGFFVTVDGVFRFVKGRRSMVLNVVLSLVVVFLVAVWLYYADF